MLSMAEEESPVTVPAIVLPVRSVSGFPRPRKTAPVVFVGDGEDRVVVRRETYDDLLRLDVE